MLTTVSGADSNSPCSESLHLSQFGKILTVKSVKWALRYYAAA